MFKTADGDTLELAPWRMRRLMRLVAEMRRYPPGTPPQALVHDLRLIIGRARRVSTQPRLGTARFESAGACCKACLLARQRQGGMELVGLSLTAPWQGGHVYEGFAPELEDEIERSGRVTKLGWHKFDSLAAATKDPVNASGPGVYILANGLVPKYVGLSKTLETRMKAHRWCAAVHHRSAAISVWVAKVTRVEDLPAVEHAIIRLLKESLNNVALKNTVLKAGKGGLRIENVIPEQFLKRASYLKGNNLLDMKASQTLEFEWLE